MFNHDTRTLRALIDFFLFLNQILYIHTNILIAETQVYHRHAFYRGCYVSLQFIKKLQLYESNYLDTLIKCKIFTKYNT